ncbi:MAG: hypothetical protein K9J12_05650 [Melioribacteraceae bacterium]|nr:hypothetical protein [Melioribacteraceae bacterium]MCF8264269.1 hypothetical protein [Melioribacteraceae bacterium]MCF8413401.1 hypothetical protein [Melioribacteraceae bacterium]MCF8431769.1 hypothetical protein [Melioribacteraceae bacterium]
MNLDREYIIQCISIASNNLRLNTDKIQVVTLLKQFVNESDDIQQMISQLKKTTTFSKFAIKLGEINDFLVRSKIDFLTVSDSFKKHSSSLISEFSKLLENANPAEVRAVFDKIRGNNNSAVERSENGTSESDREIANPLQSKPIAEHKPEETHKNEEEEFDIDQFTERILKAIKEIDSILGEMEIGNVDDDEITYYSEIMLTHAEQAEEHDFEVISKMHYIFADGFQMYRDEKLENTKETIELLRACLIIIVALVKKKNVDLTLYIEQTETLEKQINAIIKSEI